MPVTKIVYKTLTLPIVGNVSIPTGKKLVLKEIIRLDHWLPVAKGSNFVITYRDEYKYYLSCPKGKIPKKGFIKIGKGKLHMNFMHESDDKRKGDVNLYSHLDIGYLEEDEWKCETKNVKCVCPWLQLLDVKVTNYN